MFSGFAGEAGLGIVVRVTVSGGEGVFCERLVKMFLFSVIICIQKMCYIIYVFFCCFFWERVYLHTITRCWLQVLPHMKVYVYSFIVI